jgi:hypothetical protein
MAPEKPEIRIQIKLRHNLTLAIFAAFVTDVNDTVKHQHRRQRELRIARAKHPPVATIEQLFVCETFLH